MNQLHASLAMLFRLVVKSICFYWKHTRTLVLAAVVISSASLSSADVIFDNFDAGGGFHPHDYLFGATAFYFGGEFSVTRSAAKFTVTGGNFNLTSVTLPVSFQEANDTLRVRIAPDAGGAPGTTLEVLSENAAIWPAFSSPFTTTTTVMSGSNPVLTDNTMYWIVLEPTAMWNSSYNWYRNTSGATTPFKGQEATNELPMDPWSGFSGNDSPAFRVEGTIAPTCCFPLANPVITDAAPAFNASYPASSVFDNNLTTEYASQDSSTDTFIDFAFPAPTLISGFDMTQRNDNARVLTSRLILDDGPGFGSPLATVDLVHTNTAQAYNFFPFAPVNARYVRWDVLTTNSSVLKANGAAEMNFYLLPGDYNGNGTVDGADYVVWRKDPNRTQTGYNTWRTHFGRTLVDGNGGGAGASSSAVPEPATLVMLMFTMTGWCLRRGRAA